MAKGCEICELLEILHLIQPNLDIEDEFVWWKNKQRFSVKNSYERLTELSNSGSFVAEDILRGFDKLWRRKVPRKVLIFGWRLMLTRLPTRIVCLHCEPT